MAVAEPDTDSATRRRGEVMVERSSGSELSVLLRDLEALETVFEGWEENQRAAVEAYRTALEALHREALRRIIATVKEEPAALVRLK
ncbi:MAG: hypothetical protein KDD11_13105, partial [Acidobacteria bacterium]|nr:hypothetical protein [Acidobacteriota bacterium]